MTLTEAAHWTKKLVWFVIPAFLLFFLILMLAIGRDSRVHVPLYVEPDYACTTNPGEFLDYKLEISSLDYNIPPPEKFRIETDTGKYENFPEIVNVYEYDNPGQTLNSQRDATIIAENLGFQPEDIMRLEGARYRWVEGLDRELIVEARNLSFILRTNFARPGNEPNKEETPSTQNAANTARSFLRNINLLTDDYANQEPTTMQIKIGGEGELYEAKAMVETDLIRVDFHRMMPMITIPNNIEGAEEYKKALERKLETGLYTFRVDDIRTPEGRLQNYNFNIPLVTDHPYKSNISVYVGSRNENFKNKVSNIYQVEYKNWIINPIHCGTYKLLPPSLAINEIQSGNGSLIYLRENDGDRVTPHKEKDVEMLEIRDIYIQYYDGPKEQEFLQPIYAVIGNAVFSSGEEGEFLFYYPAIDYDSIPSQF